MLSSLLAGKVISIHAPSRERRQVLFCRPAGRRHFNPRSLAGATKMIIGKAYDGQISIHAPSRERRSLKMLKIYLALISIHAPSRERPQTSIKHIIKSHISIHAPSRERLFEQHNKKAKRQISIHAPSRERLSQASMAQLQLNFNPRSLAGATTRRHNSC